MPSDTKPEEIIAHTRVTLMHPERMPQANNIPTAMLSRTEWGQPATGYRSTGSFPQIISSKSALQEINQTKS